MRNLLFLFVMVYPLSLCAVTVTLRGGRGTVEGALLETNDTHVVISTEEGKKEIAWPHVTRQTLIDLHPALYKELLEKAKARQAEKEAEMKEKGMVKVDGKWVDEKKLLKRIRLHVIYKEDKGSYEKDDRMSSNEVEYKSRNIVGECVIELKGLDRDMEYDVEVVYSHYVKYDSEFKSDFFTEFADGRTDAEEKVTKKIKDKLEDTLTIKSKEYQYVQAKVKEGKWVGGGRKREYGFESEGWDIKVTINGHEVYTRTKDGEEKYTIVQKR